MADLSRRVVLVSGVDGSFARGIAAGLAEAGAGIELADPAPGRSGAAALVERIRRSRGRLDVLVAGPHADAALPAEAARVIAAGGLIVRLTAVESDPCPADWGGYLPDGVVLVTLQVAPSAHFTGRCLAALAMDPDIGDRHLGSYDVASLAGEYRFSHPDARPG